MKRRDDKILVHVAPSLKTEVRAAAEAEGRSISDYVRRVLIEHTAARIADQPAQAA